MYTPIRMTMVREANIMDITLILCFGTVTSLSYDVINNQRINAEPLLTTTARSKAECASICDVTYSCVLVSASKSTPMLCNMHGLSEYMNTQLSTGHYTLKNKGNEHYI